MIKWEKIKLDMFNDLILNWFKLTIKKQLKQKKYKNMGELLEALKAKLIDNKDEWEVETWDELEENYEDHLAAEDINGSDSLEDLIDCLMGDLYDDYDELLNNNKLMVELIQEVASKKNINLKIKKAIKF